MNLNFSLLQQAVDPNAQMMSTFVTIGLLVLISYFLVIRPQKKEKDKMQKMVKELKEGDRIRSIGGILGKVVKMKEKSVVIKISDGASLELLKEAISLVEEDNSKKKDKNDSKTESKEDNSKKKDKNDSKTEEDITKEELKTEIDITKEEIKE